jgi:hypothetical protein
MPMEAATKVIAKGTLASLIRYPGHAKGSRCYRDATNGPPKASLLLTSSAPPIRKQHPSMICSIACTCTLPFPEPWTTSSTVRLFSDLETEIRNATKSVDTRVFIFDNDDYAVRFADLLRWKSQNASCRVFNGRTRLHCQLVDSTRKRDAPGFQISRVHAALYYRALN